MNDLELTKACAQAMGADADGKLWRELHQPPTFVHCKVEIEFDPLHDDAQAMALVKKFRLDIHQPISNVSGKWGVVDRNRAHGPQDAWQAWNTDLNRAICEVVVRDKSDAAASGPKEVE